MKARRWLAGAFLWLLPLTAAGQGAATPPQPADAPYLYRAQTVQAAPGKLLELIDLFKQKAAEDMAAGEEAPLWMRHSQGDHWDLLILTPMQGYTAYYQPDRAARRAARANRWRERLETAVAWQEDGFVWGPPVAELRKAFAGNGFFHVEMFIALPGKQAELRRQREMENAYLRMLGRPQNFIFVRDQGAAWDLFTLGIYRDLKHYAESADIPEEKQEAAAKAAGFAAASQIGPYLRTLIRNHHDTLAVAIR